MYDFFSLEFLVCWRRAWFVFRFRQRLPKSLADVLRHLSQMFCQCPKVFLWKSDFNFNIQFFFKETSSPKIFSGHLRCRFLLWGFVSAPEMGEENSTSGPGSSEGRSSLVPWFTRLLLLDVPGATTEQVLTCGFKRNSSSFDKAPKIRDSVLLNSFESFLVNLPSISSETWEI